MLAIRTGWTPDVIAGETGTVSNEFREAAHWALYAEAMSPLLDELSSIRTLSMENVSLKDKARIAGLKLSAARDEELYRSYLFPEDPTDG